MLKNKKILFIGPQVYDYHNKINSCYGRDYNNERFRRHLIKKKAKEMLLNKL
jgi:hypothetical protein